MPLVRLGPHACNPIPEPHKGWAAIPRTLPADMPCLNDGDSNAPQTRLAFASATLIPLC
jgi:hypothetical protein